MAIRGFGSLAVTGTAQPVFGTTLTAAITPTPDRYTGNFNPASNQSIVIIPVTNPFIFRQNDRVVVGATATFTLANTVAPDVGRIQTVDYIGNTITVVGLTRAHASGEWAVLAISAATVNVQTNASPLYLGEDSSIAANSHTLARILNPGQLYEIGPSSGSNVHGTSHYWILGTAADTYIPCITTV